MKLTIAQLKKLPVSDRNKAVIAELERVKTVRKEPKGLAYIKSHLTAIGVDYIAEYRFHSVRKWRFDIALPSVKVAIEYDGLFSAKSRHTTAKGFTGDADKLNAAAGLGWVVYRYTALNYKDITKINLPK